MAKRKPKPVPSLSDVIDLDKIIDEEAGNLELTPTNLIRGGMVKDAVSTGSLAVDLIMGGGWAPGRRSNVFGREQSGKSTMLYFAVKACIAQGIYTIFYDFEGSTDADRVERIGVKINWAKELEKKEPILFRYYDRMVHGEQTFRHAKRIMDRLPDKDDGKIQVAFFLDSLPTVLPQSQAEDDETGANALRARLFSDQLPLVKSRIAGKRCIWIDTNALKTNPRQKFGNPEYEQCGDSVKTLSDVRLRAKKTIPPPKRNRAEKKSYIEEEPCWDGFGVDRYTFSELYTTKNKAFSPFRSCIIRIWFEEAGQPGRGIDPVFDVWEYLRLTGQIKNTKRQFHINLPPFNEEREINIAKLDKKGNEEIDPKTGEVIFQIEKRILWTWGELKDLILNPANTKGKERKKWDIVAACRKQINSEAAFKMYFDNLVKTDTARAKKAQAADEAEE